MRSYRLVALALCSFVPLAPVAVAHAGGHTASTVGQLLGSSTRLVPHAGRTRILRTRGPVTRATSPAQRSAVAPLGVLGTGSPERAQQTIGVRIRNTTAHNVDVLRSEQIVGPYHDGTEQSRGTIYFRDPAEPIQEVERWGGGSQRLRAIDDGSAHAPMLALDAHRFEGSDGIVRTRGQIVGHAEHEELAPGREHVAVTHRSGVVASGTRTDTLYDVQTPHALTVQSASRVRFHDAAVRPHVVRSIASTNYGPDGRPVTTVRAVFDHAGGLARQVVIDHRDGRVYSVDREGVYRDGRGRVLDAAATQQLERGAAPGAPSQAPRTARGGFDVSAVNQAAPELRAVNCVRCAIATDHTLAGHPEVVTGGEASSRLIEAAYGRPFQAATFGSVVGDMLRAGNGARGIVAGLRGTSGHAFNVVNDRGTVRFFDGQRGSGLDHTASVFSNLMFMRTDDAAPRPAH